LNETPHQLGTALMQNKEPAAAVAPLKRAVERNPRSAPIRTDLAAAYLMLQKFSDTVEHARAALELDKTYAGAHALLGIGLLNTGDAAGARAAMLEAIRLDPKTLPPALSKALPPETAALPVAPPPRAK
jgi:Flp pilus assembly protein TadD